MIPALYEYAVETVYPVGEGSSIGFLVGGGSIFGVFYLLIFSFLFDSEVNDNTIESLYVILIVTISIAIGTILIFFTTEKHKR